MARYKTTRDAAARLVSGERFLVIRQPGTGATKASTEPERQRIDVVLNGFTELESRVPIE